MRGSRRFGARCSRPQAPGVRERCLAALSEALGVAEGPSVNAVATSLGLDGSVLWCACPHKYKELVALRKEEQKKRHARYREAMARELERDRPRDAGSLAASLGVCTATLKRAPGVLYNRLLGKRERWVAEQRRASERKAEARAEGVEAKRVRLCAALERELASERPRAPCAVARECKVPQSNLEHFCGELYGRLKTASLEAEVEGARRGLEAEIESAEPRAAEAVLAELGLRRVNCAERFPELVRSLEAGRERARAAARDAKYRPYVEPLERELASGEPRSISALCEEHSVTHGVFRSASKPLHDAVVVAARGAKKRTEEKDRRRLVEALEREARSTAPRSANALAKALGKSTSDLQRSDEGVYRSFLQARERWKSAHDERLRGIVVRALEAALRSPSPRSVRALERSLGVPVHTCKRKAFELHDRLLAHIDAVRRSNPDQKAGRACGREFDGEEGAVGWRPGDGARWRRPRRLLRSAWLRGA